MMVLKYCTRRHSRKGGRREESRENMETNKNVFLNLFLLLYKIYTCVSIDEQALGLTFFFFFRFDY